MIKHEAKVSHYKSVQCQQLLRMHECLAVYALESNEIRGGREKDVVIKAGT